MTSNFFYPSLLLLFLDPGPGMGKNQDPGSGINILDLQHCLDPDPLTQMKPDPDPKHLPLD